MTPLQLRTVRNTACAKLPYYKREFTRRSHLCSDELPWDRRCTDNNIDISDMHKQVFAIRINLTVSLEASADMRMEAQIRVATRHPYGSSGLKASAMSNMHRQTGEELGKRKRTDKPPAS